MRIQAICLVMGLSWTLVSNAQTPEQPTPKALKFGFEIGLLKDTYPYVAEASIEPLPYTANALRLGILAEYGIGNHFSISAKSGLVMAENRVLKNNNGDDLLTGREVRLEFALHALYKFTNKTSRPYLLAGPNLRLPIDKSVSTTQFGYNSGVAMEFGVGFEKAFKWFMFAPEIRYSRGLTNISRNPSFTEIRHNTITLALTFKP